MEYTINQLQSDKKLRKRIAAAIKLAVPVEQDRLIARLIAEDPTLKGRQISNRMITAKRTVLNEYRAAANVVAEPHVYLAQAKSEVEKDRLEAEKKLNLALDLLNTNNFRRRLRRFAGLQDAGQELVVELERLFYLIDGGDENEFQQELVIKPEIVESVIGIYSFAENRWLDPEETLLLDNPTPTENDWLTAYVDANGNIIAESYLQQTVVYGDEARFAAGFRLGADNLLQFINSDGQIYFMGQDRNYSEFDGISYNFETGFAHFAISGVNGHTQERQIGLDEAHEWFLEQRLGEQHESRLA